MTSLRNRRLSIARAWLHDHACLSGDFCNGDNDHARRTQHANARTLVDTWTQWSLGGCMRDALHDIVCRDYAGCPARAAHAESSRMHQLCAELAEELELAQARGSAS